MEKIVEIIILVEGIAILSAEMDSRTLINFRASRLCKFQQSKILNSISATQNCHFNFNFSNPKLLYNLGQNLATKTAISTIFAKF